MGGNMSRNKGQRGEREAAALLMEWATPVVDAVRSLPDGAERLLDDVVLVRNLMQSRAGGYDIDGLPWLALEVKRHETLSVPAWWRQTLDQTGKDQVACLMYRMNRTQWRFKVRLLVGHYGKVVTGVSSLDVEMSIDEAKKWFKSELYYRLL